MAFIRIKKIKKWKYAYLVENVWKSGKTMQEVKQYLGKVHKLEADSSMASLAAIDIGSMKFKDAAKMLVKLELARAGFKECKEGMKKGSLLANIEECSFIDGKKPVVLEANEGFICSFTFGKIINFRKCPTEEETGLKLAEAVLDAGLSLPSEVFVKLFEKVHKPEMPFVEDMDQHLRKVI